VDLALGALFPVHVFHDKVTRLADSELKPAGPVRQVELGEPSRILDGDDALVGERPQGR
jgi:hypothetical protein